MKAKDPKETKPIYTEHTPEIIPVDTHNYQDEFLYGKSIEKINTNQINWAIIWAKFWSSSVNSTWNHSITWVWFKPSRIKITANKLGNNWVSTWYSEWVWTDFVMYWYNITTTAVLGWLIVDVTDNTWTPQWQATLSSFDSDWFTLNWTIATGTINFIYECYG